MNLIYDREYDGSIIAYGSEGPTHWARLPDDDPQRLRDCIQELVR